MFPLESSFYTFAFMPIINCIKYKAEGKTRAYAFAFLIFSKSSFAGNQLVFEDLNVVQMGIDKKNI